MSKVHNFVEDSDRQYYRVVFCRKCGKVAWFYNRGADWNMDNPQTKLGDCVEDGEDIMKPPTTISKPKSKKS